MPGDPDIPPESPDAQDYSADDMANTLLRNKNIHEFKSIIAFSGMLVFPNGAPMQSGSTVTIANKGLFSGKWIIQMVRFAILEGKMVTELDLRKCIPAGQVGTVSTIPGPPEEKGPIKDEVPDKPPQTTSPTSSPSSTVANQTQTEYARSQLSIEEQKLVDMAPNTGGAEQQAAIDKYNQGLSDYLFQTNPVSH